MTLTPPKPKRWLLAVDPRVYHWDTLFVKGKEMWRQAGDKPDALRQLKQVHKGDRALCYHGKPEHAVYALAEVTRDPYPDPHERDGKNMVMDLRAMERLPRQVSLAEMREDKLLRKLKFLKNTRMTICALTEEEYAEILRLAGIVASPGIPLP
ncbi:MAG TPA: EVE domain-containing protein [Candidatus Dormibacteraeota bacterium]|nr:EVE domain-containing protein [Candidatus Dormibacteraeota bacterium]